MLGEPVVGLYTTNFFFYRHNKILFIQANVNVALSEFLSNLDN